MRAQKVFEFAVNTDEKYYAAPELVDYVVDKTLEVIGEENVEEIIEPSAGDGAFIEKLDSTGIPVQYFDMAPEHPRIETMKFQDLNLPYKKGRLFLGGPPYGKGSKLYLMFIRHAAEMGDYIAYISPPNFHEENPYPEFLDVLHTEQLPIYTFLGSKVRKEKDVPMKSSFNIYKVVPGRDVPINPKLQQLEKDFLIKQYERRGETGKRKRVLRNYDYYLSNWGIDLGNWYTDVNDTKATSIGILVKNRNLTQDLEEFLEEFRESYYSYFQRRSTGAPGIQIEKFKKILADYLY